MVADGSNKAKGFLETAFVTDNSDKNNLNHWKIKLSGENLESF